SGSGTLLRSPRRALPLGVFIFVLALTSGCGEQPLDPAALVPVSGTVTLDGAPCAGAEVTFVPLKGNAAAHGLTDGTGQYTLAEVLPGAYQVRLLRMTVDGAGVDPALAP